jgi:hypothetical protein
VGEAGDEALSDICSEDLRKVMKDIRLNSFLQANFVCGTSEHKAGVF